MKLFLSRILSLTVGILLLVQLLYPGFVWGEHPINSDFPEEELKEYLKSAASTLAIPGLSVAVSRHGELLYSQGFGKDITPDTIFYIGSISKSFTGLGIMQLVEQGAVELDASVSTYLPAFTVSDKITVRHLLSHTSGMTEFGYMANLPLNSTFDELIKDMNRMTLTNIPGEQFSYFNQNYSLLGAIIESTSGKTYEEYMETNVLSPLGLNQTSVRGVVDVTGHLSVFGFSVPRDEPFKRYDLPAGYITSTVNDLIKYLDAIQSRNPLLGLTAQGVEVLLDAQPYGMGWMASPFAGHSAIHHGGSLPGYVANAIMLPDEGYNITLLANKNHLMSAMFMYPELANGIVAILTNQHPPNPFGRIWVFRILMLLFAWNAFSILRSLIRLVQSTQQHALSKRVRAIVFNLALPMAIVYFIPIGSRALLGRGMTWPLAFLMMPDLLSWLFVGMASHVLTAVIHLSHALKEHRTPTSRSLLRK